MDQMTVVYDLEQLANLFTYTGYDYKNDTWYQFVISDWRNDFLELCKHLENVKLMIGYNNNAYDYLLLHHLMNHANEYQHYGGQEIAVRLYNKSQEIINQKFSKIADRNKFIPQIDLYALMGYDSMAMHTSLKDLEIAMRLENVEEMPIHYTTWCKKGDEDCILSYNKNDVYATYKFLEIVLGRTDHPQYKGDNRIELRSKLQKKFGINVINTPDIRIGEQMMLKLYCNKTGDNPNGLKKCGGTPRDKIALKDCMPSWVHFETKPFKELYNTFCNTVVDGHNFKGAFSTSCIFNAYKIDYGTGGAHGCIKPGVYEAKDGKIIVDSDIGSLYPSIAIQLGIYPEHLGPEFRDLYEKEIVGVRLAEKAKPKAERDNVIMTGYKKAANCIYGKSNEETSPFYDPLYTLKTTVGGQMFISMWSEKLWQKIPEITFIQTNTDGLTYIIPESKLDDAMAVNEEMKQLTGLFIEDNFYSKMIVRDVNNYISVYSDSTPEHEHVKLKGCFEIDPELHKDPSMRIVPIALKNYFVYGTPIKDTLINHKDIYDFCLRLKLNSTTHGVYKYLCDKGICEDELQRTTRYYVSKVGGIFLKEFSNGSQSGVNVGYSCTIFNKYEKKEMSEYNINYDFYLAEVKKIKDVIEDKQLNLFGW